MICVQVKWMYSYHIGLYLTQIIILTSFTHCHVTSEKWLTANLSSLWLKRSINIKRKKEFEVNYPFNKTAFVSFRSLWLSQFLFLSNSPFIPFSFLPIGVRWNRAKAGQPQRLTRKQHYPSVLFFTHMNISRIHQLFILTISTIFLSEWLRLPKPKANLQPGKKQQLKTWNPHLFGRFMSDVEPGEVFLSRYLSQASIVGFSLVRFSFPYCELKYLLQSNYCRDLGQHSPCNSKKCGPQHWHKHLSMLEEASLPLNKADAS